MTELDLRLDLRWTPRGALVALAALLLCLPQELSSENVVLSTTYPPPGGVYSQILTTQATKMALVQFGFLVVGSNASGVSVTPSTTTQLAVLAPGGAARVGIGTINPQTTLDIENNTMGVPLGGGLAVNGTNPGVRLGVGGPSLSSDVSNDAVVNSAGGVVLGPPGAGAYVDGQGVGIGSPPLAPLGALDVNGDVLGRTWNVSMPCPSPAQACGPGTSWSSVQCNCVAAACTPVVCPPGQIWDAAACLCISACVPMVCPPFTIWDGHLCVCVPSLGGGGGCFVDGTPVWTPSGKVPIERVKTGDLVYSVDPASFALVPKKVLGTETKVVDDVLSVSLSNGTTLRATPIHPFLDVRTGRFEPIGKMKAGDEVAVLAGPALDGAAEEPEGFMPDAETDVRITSISRLPSRPTVVHNLHVEGPYHDYIVDGVLVHNKILLP